MSSRRDFLKTSLLATGALSIGFRLTASPKDPAPFKPNAYVRVDPDGRVTLTVAKSEMGQGVRTALPMILAEELEVDLSEVRLEQAQPGPQFTRLGTGGSTSIMTTWAGLRKAGAAAREMLVGAAATRWGVDAATCRAEKGRVLHPATKRSFGYGELVEDAARRQVPAEPRVKQPGERRLVGTSPLRLDGPDIVQGKALYGIDVNVPGMAFATLIRPPVVGATLQSFDGEKARQLKGVVSLVETSRGLAVVAESTWTALKARELVKVKWSEPAASAAFDSASHLKALKAAAASPGITTLKHGEGLAAFGRAAKKLEAEYVYPFEAHAPVEPMNCTAQVKDGKCKLWAPTQSPNALQNRTATLLGLKPEDVTVHVTLMGGGFGRRLNHDFGVEAAELASKLGRPVQLVWSRTDDMRYGHLQPASVHRLYAGIEGGRLVAWGHRKASALHNTGGEPTPEQMKDANRLRGSSWGVYDVPYEVPNIETFHSPLLIPARLGAWRAVYAPSSVFARESFLDEVAHALGKDPVAFRLELLGEGAAMEPKVVRGDLTLDRERLRRVIKLAAEKAGWGKPLPAGRARGFACNQFEGGTLTASVVEVSLRKGKGGLPFQVHRVVSAVDVGVVINPLGVAQQVESGALWAISNLKTEITFKAGAVEQSGYSDFEVARWEETPIIETHIVPSQGDAPTGLGEPAVLTLPPAVAGALFALTGKRVRSLPIKSV